MFSDTHLSSVTNEMYLFIHFEVYLFYFKCMHLAVKLLLKLVLTFFKVKCISYFFLLFSCSTSITVFELYRYGCKMCVKINVYIPKVKPLNLFD